MPVLFDISVLGYGEIGPSFRTGVYRSVENLALSLLAVRTGQTRFCAASSPEAWALANAYWRSGPLSRADFIPVEGGGLYGPVQRTFTRWNRVEGASPFLRLGRRALGELANRWKDKVPTLSAEDFSGTVYHSPYYAFPEITGGQRRVLTVHDLIALRTPEAAGDSGEYLRTIVGSIRPDDTVVCVSDWTREELLQFAPRLKPEQVHVVGWAADDGFRPVEAKQITRVKRVHGLSDRPYFVSVGTEGKRKNLPLLIEAFGELLRRRPDCEADLVLVGAKGGHSKAIEATAATAGRVHRLGFVGDEDLAALYSGAVAFALPSLYEGFGLPVLEAMQCETPVMASDSSALSAVVGEGGVRISPNDGQAWSHAMEKLYDSETERSAWREKGKQWARRFSWRRTADEYTAIYRNILAR